MNYANVKYCERNVIIVKKELLELIEQLDDDTIEYLINLIKGLFF
jgi:hypothetical protein